MFTDFGNSVVQHQMVEEWWRRRLADQIDCHHLGVLLFLVVVLAYHVPELQIVESVVVWTDQHAYLIVVISDHLAIVIVLAPS